MFEIYVIDLLKTEITILVTKLSKTNSKIARNCGSKMLKSS